MILLWTVVYFSEPLMSASESINLQSFFFVAKTKSYFHRLRGKDLQVITNASCPCVLDRYSSCRFQNLTSEF